MDDKFIKRIARTNLVSSIIFLAMAAIAIVFCVWFSIELGTGNIFGLGGEKQAEDAGQALGEAFGLIFIIIIFLLMDFGFGILAIIFLATGIPLLINSITLFRIDQIGDVAIVAKKLRRSRVVFVVSIVIGAIITLVSIAAFISFLGEGGEIQLIFVPIFVFLVGLFLIIFSSIEFKKVGKIIVEIAGQSEL